MAEIVAIFIAISVGVIGAYLAGRGEARAEAASEVAEKLRDLQMRTADLDKEAEAKIDAIRREFATRASLPWSERIKLLSK